MKLVKKVRVNGKLAKRNFNRLETEDKVGVSIFSGVMSLLVAVVITWAQSGFVSYYGF